MNWKTVNGFIFDVDGTLYNQRKMRLTMLGRLMAYYSLRPLRLRELFAVYRFRKLREDDRWKRADFDTLYAEIARETRLTADAVKASIEHWMFQAPLDALKICAYRDVMGFVHVQHESGKRVIVYSDYPAADKLAALGMDHDAVYAFGQTGMDEQKPSERIIRRIVAESGLSPESMLYIGDRDDRDRASADMAGIPYCDIRAFRKELKAARGAGR